MLTYVPSNASDPPGITFVELFREKYLPAIPPYHMDRYYHYDYYHYVLLHSRQIFLTKELNKLDVKRIRKALLDVVL